MLRLSDLILRLPSNIKTLFLVFQVQQAALMPEEESDMRRYLFEMWQAKDRMIDGFYQTGEIAGYPDNTGRQLTFSYRRWILLHAIFYCVGLFYLWSAVHLFSGIKWAFSYF